jgi:glycosyltransferase involved in cell wall biosynthesis
MPMCLPRDGSGHDSAENSALPLCRAHITRSEMRILIVSQYFWPESFRINEVTESLVTAGCEVTVLTGQPNYPGGKTLAGYRALGAGKDPSPRSYDLFRVPLIPRGRGGAGGLIANYLSFIVFASLLGPWLLRGRRFDVIFVYGVSPIFQAIPAILLKWLKRTPLVLWVQDLWPESLQVTGYVKNRTLLAIAAGLVRWIYRRCDLILGQSRSFVDAIIPMAGRVPVEFFPTPGDVPAPHVEVPALVLPAGFNIVFAGNMGTAQALPTILEAATILRHRKDIRFVLIGDGSQRDWLVSEVARAGLDNISMPGRFPSTAIAGILSQASALLVTLNRSDAMARTIPAKISTYMAAGKPIVAAIDGEGGRAVSEAGAGIACAAEDAAALVDAVNRLVDMSAAEREQMGLAGRAYYNNNFEPDMLTSRLIAFFSKAASHRHADRRTAANDR